MVAYTPLDYSLLLRLLCSRILGGCYDTDQAAKRSSRFSGRLPEQAWLFAELRGDCALTEADFAGHGAQTRHDARAQGIRQARLQPEPVNRSDTASQAGARAGARPAHDRAAAD